MRVKIICKVRSEAVEDIYVKIEILFTDMRLQKKIQNKNMEKFLSESITKGWDVE